MRSAPESSPAKHISIWERLLEPAASIREPERRRVRLLSALLATLFILGLLSTVLTFSAVYGSLYLGVGATLIVAGIYYLSRTRYYNLAALLMVGALSAAIFAVVILDPNPIPLYFLVLGVLASSLFLSRRDTALIMAASILGIGLLLVFVPALPMRDAINAMFAVLCVGTLGIVGITIRQQDLEQIQEQARLLAEDVALRQQTQEELQRRLTDFEAVNQLSAAMRESQSLDQLLPLVLDNILEILHATVGSLWLYDETRNELRTAATRGYGEQEGAAPSPPEKPGEGIAGYVFATRKPYIEKNLHQSLRLPEAKRRQISPGMSVAAIPIRAADQVIGVLCISTFLPRELAPNEIHLLTTLNEIAGNTIQRTMFHQQTEQRLQHLIALSEIDRAILSSFDLRVSLGALLDQVIAQLGVDAADVLLFDSNSLALECVVKRGFRKKSARRIQPSLDKGYAGKAILDRELVKIENIKEQHDDKFLTLLGKQETFVSYCAVPLMAKGYTKGVLEVFKRAPLEPDEEWFDFLDMLAGQATIAIDNASLFDSLQHSNAELSRAYNATIEGWSHALDLRDKETEGHTLRVTEMTMKLARAFDLSEEELAEVRWGALLHDIGKMGIPDVILLKSGSLTDDEWEVMRKHPTYAHEMLSPIHYLRSALDIPYCHHEKWDGTGYPRGLKGKQIPLTARIFAIVDVWDALSSNRPYRPAWPKEKVRAHIEALSGTHFDPCVVEAFSKIIEM
ncbi:MAG: HD domain-containing phosphohydrolase [Anaerolineales bacterium]